MAIKVKRMNQVQAELYVKREFMKAVRYRSSVWESGWKRNESYVFPLIAGNGESLSFTSAQEVLAYMKENSSNKQINLPQIAKNVRYLQSQMSANPPSIMPVPTSSDQSSARAAKAASCLSEYGREQYRFQEVQDLDCLSAIVYGTGISKLYNDPNAGEPKGYNPAKGIAEAQGDIQNEHKSVWDIWFSADAKVFDKILDFFESEKMPVSKAKALWPDAEEMIEVEASQSVLKSGEQWGMLSNADLLRDDTIMREGVDGGEGTVEVIHWHQKGTIYNGFLGYQGSFLRGCFKFLEEPTESLQPDALHPYDILTDLDCPGHVYGKSTLDFAIPLGLIVDQLDGMAFDNIETHGNIKVLVYNSSEINDSDLNTDPVEIIRVQGNPSTAPTHLAAPPLTIDIYKLRENLKKEIDDIMGINDVLQGNFKKDLSGFSAQTAINAANLVRRRLFNKYTAYVKSKHEKLNANVIEFWEEKRELIVVGTEKYADVKYLKGSDIAKGYVLRAQYGESFSADPASRREEIMQMMPILEKAGVSPKFLIGRLQFNEIQNLVDYTELAKQRQLEIFDRMIKTFEETGVPENIPADEMKIAYHADMAQAALDYFMTREFDVLPSELKAVMYEHYADREKLAALMAAGKEPSLDVDLEAAPAAAPTPGAPSTPQIPGLPPPPAAGPVPGASPVEAPIAASPVGDAGVVI